MRYVELRRHTDNDGDRLNERGITDAEAIGRTGLHPPYVLFVSTGAERANEMLRILRRAAGQDEVEIITETTLRSVVEDRWREAETRLLGAALLGIVEALPGDGRALIVGHSPTNEAAVLGLTGQTVTPLGKGEGVLIVEDAGRYDVQPL